MFFGLQRSWFPPSISEVQRREQDLEITVTESRDVSISVPSAEVSRPETELERMTRLRSEHERRHD